MQDLLQQLELLRGFGGDVAMATLVATRGASPRLAGARMWVAPGGQVLGAVTIGGCVDARVVEAADAVLRDGAPTLLRVDMGEEDAWDLGFSCAAALDVYVEPVRPDSVDDPAMAAFESAARHIAAGGRAVIATRLDAPGRLAVLDDGASEGTLGDVVLDAEARARAATLFGARPAVLELGAEPAVPVFFEPHSPAPQLVIFGAGPVTPPLLRFARTLGMRTLVVDWRERYAEPGALPDADEVRVGRPGDVAGELAYGPETAVVLVAHDYKHDLPVLRRILDSGAGYIGLLGSRRRAGALLEFLAEEGLPAEALARVHAPVGLDIGAESPEELALSILAEVLAVRTGRAGGMLRGREP